MSLAWTAPAAAAPEPQPYGANDAGGFLNVLPPGQNGHANAADVVAFTALGKVFGSGPAPPHASQVDRIAPRTICVPVPGDQ